MTPILNRHSSPPVWYSGAVVSITGGRSERPAASARVMPWRATISWVRSTPLEAPVVPLVNRSRAGSVPSSGAWTARSSFRRNSCSHRSLPGMPSPPTQMVRFTLQQAPQMAAAASLNSGPYTSAAAPARLTARTSSSCFSRLCRGAMTAPSFWQAYHSRAHSTPFFISTATRAPLVMPRRLRALARQALSCSSSR